MKIIDREFYLNSLIEVKNTPDIKIITGVRRSGKSKLMERFCKYIEEEDSDANIIFIDFNNLLYESLKEYHKLNEYVESKYKNGVSNYLMIDEIQECKNFEKVINSLHSSEKYDIYLTGSNAFLLGSDLSTYFTGRFIEIKVYPFSYQEYCRYHEINTSDNSSFDSYMIDGGLAGSYIYESPEKKSLYIKGIYDTIVHKDLVTRYSIKDETLLRHVSDYLMDNISNLTTPSKISNTLISNNYKTNHVTIDNYIRYLSSAFLFYNVRRYDIRGKQYLNTMSKLYLVDQGFRFANLGTKNVDYGRVNENIVAIELLRRGYEIYVGKLYAKEVDFVVRKGNQQIYIQVSDNLESEDTIKREITPLLMIKDAFPKIIIARTNHPEYSIDGVRVIDIKDWLIDVNWK